MTKLAKNCYYNKDGQKKVNCYILNIPKKTLEQAKISENDNIEIIVEDEKIIIKKCSL